MGQVIAVGIFLTPAGMAKALVGVLVVALGVPIYRLAGAKPPAAHEQGERA